MTCSYCQLEFDPAQSRAACAACAFVGGGCKSIRCPRCRYEMPEPVQLPRFLQWLAPKEGGTR